MIEPYQWLVKNCEELGYKRENIGPASVDLCLGDIRNLTHTSSVVHNIYMSFVFYPGTFYLASTVEYIKVPTTHCAFVNMRSSWARKGLGHKMAGFIDPGFEGEITLELETSIDIEIARGDRIVQIIYCKLSEETEKSYEGKYKGQKGPTEAYRLGFIPS